MVDLSFGRALRGWGGLAACTAAIGVAMGAAFVVLGVIEEQLGLPAHNALDLFATGFACGAVAAVVALLSSVDTEARKRATAGSDQHKQRLQ